MTAKTLVLAGQRLIAYSVGGIETCFQLPDYNVNFDIGRCPPGAERQGVLLLTHGHIDHAAGLPYYVSMRGLLNLSPPRVFVPAESRAVLSEILHGWARLQSDSLRCTLTGVEPQEVLPLSKDRFVRTFRSPHRIACVGYTIFRRSRKLKPELTHLSQEELIERSRLGEEVQEVVDVPEVCFPGDTSIEILEQDTSITTARLLLLECTFLAPKVSVEKAQRGGHIHLDQLAEHAPRFQNEAILLTHFSRRHPRAEVEAAVREKLPASLRDRVHLLLHDEP